MGTSYSGCLAGGKAGMRIAGAYQELPGSQEHVDAMVCEPATSVPSNSAGAEGGEGNLQDRVDCGAHDGKTFGWPTMITSGNAMFNNVADGRFRRGNFSDFLSFLQRFPPGDESNFHEYRNFSKAAVVGFLEDRNDEIIKAAFQQNDFYQSNLTALTGKHEQQLGKTRELSWDLEKVSKELSVAQAQVISTRSSLDTALAEIQDRCKAVQAKEKELEKLSKERQELSKRRESIQKDMTAQRTDFEAKLRQSKEAGEAKEREVHQQKSVIEKIQIDLRNMEATKIHWTSECEKLKSQLAAIEQKSAQESLTSGSYADGQVNPSMLEIACKSFDKATDNLARFLHENSVCRKSNVCLKAPEVQSFIGKISFATPADFSRLAQVKHVWGHWICATMFHGFENVFFDVGGDRTSPLDFKKHATESFQSFQKYEDVSAMEYQKSCPMFQAFCAKTYPLLFPLHLLDKVLQLNSMPIISCSSTGRFEGDGELYVRFLEVAKATWLLHKLSSSFDPPASILRMGFGAQFDKQYHESLIKDADNGDMSQRVVLMVRPAFRIRNTIIKSRVFVSKKSA